MLNIPNKMQGAAMSYHCIIDPTQLSARLVNNVVAHLKGEEPYNYGKAVFISDLILRHCGVVAGDFDPLRRKPILLDNWRQCYGVRNDLIDDNVLAQLYEVGAAVSFDVAARGAPPHYDPTGGRWTIGYTIIPGGANFAKGRVNLLANPDYGKAVQPMVDALLAGEQLTLNIAGGAAELVARERTLEAYSLSSAASQRLLESRRLAPRAVIPPPAVEVPRVPTSGSRVTTGDIHYVTPDRFLIYTTTA